MGSELVPKVAFLGWSPFQDPFYAEKSLNSPEVPKISFMGV